MYCPNCNQQGHLEIDLHADGFSADLLECVECGALLTTNKQQLETIHRPNSSSDIAGLAAV
jgi:Zn ribbon nucleic-acid-binding protein